MSNLSTPIKIVTTQTASESPKILPSSFPQGSILVVPHAPGSFHTILPVFANTAVIMPQGGPLTSSPSTPSIVSSISDLSSSFQVSKTSAAAVTVTASSQLPASGVSNVTALLSDQMATAITIDGRLLGLGAASMPAKGAGGEAHMVKLVQQAMETVGTVEGVGGVLAGSSPQLQMSTPATSTASAAVKKDGRVGSTNEKKPEPAVPEGCMPQVVPGSLYPQVPRPFNQVFLTSSGLTSFPQIYTMKVDKPIQVGKVSLESTSIELTGQVPIKKVDTKTLAVMKTANLCESMSSNLDVGVVSEKGCSGKKVETLAEDSVGESEKVRVVAEEGGEERKRKRKLGKNKELDGKDKSKKNKKDEDEMREDKEEVEEKVDVKESDAASDGFRGHSSADLMSAKLLLSLTEGSRKDWSVSPSKKLAGHDVSQTLGTSSPSSSPHTTSGGRKRKQKPIASAKPPEEIADGKAKLEGKTNVSTALPKAKRVRKVKKDQASLEEEQAKKKTVKEKGGVVVKSKQFTPQELLEILNIPPSTSVQDKGGVVYKTGKG